MKRIVEIKHATGQQIPYTTIVREYPEPFRRGFEPFYPVPCPATKVAYSRYAGLAKSEPDVYFVGRLARYRYYNMDQVVAMALNEADRVLELERHRPPPAAPRAQPARSRKPLTA